MYIMKVVRVIYALLMLSAVHACTDLSSYEKELEHINNEADRLGRLCDEINDKISSMQSLASQISSREDITGISQLLDEDGEVTGYTVTFRNSETITFSLTSDKQSHDHGLSVRKDDDGMWWTFNGEYLTGTDGLPIPVGGSEGASRKNPGTH